MRLNNFIITLTFLLIFFNKSFAATLTATTSTFSTVYSGAGNGDVILLDAGTYTTAITFPTTNTITIKGNPNASSMPADTIITMYEKVNQIKKQS